MNKHIITRLAVSVLGIFGASTVMAQDIGEYECLDMGFSTKFAVTAGLGHRAESDIDDGGKSSLTSFRVVGGTAMNVNERWSFTFLGSYTLNHYDFDDLGGDPWEDIHTLRFTPIGHYRLNEQWSLFGGPSVGFSAEDGADLSDSVTFGGILGFNYRASERLSLGLGLGVFSQIEDDVKVLPVPIVNWQIADDWALKVGFQEVAANGGLGAELLCTLNEQWKLGGGVQVQQRRFRLSNENVGRDRSGSVYLKAGWQPNPKFGLEAMVGIAAGGEYQVEDEDGHELGDTDYDPSALFGVRGVFTF